MMRQLVCKYSRTPMEAVDGLGRRGFYFRDRCPRCGAVAVFEATGGQLSVRWFVGDVPRSWGVRPWLPDELRGEGRRG